MKSAPFFASLTAFTMVVPFAGALPSRVRGAAPTYRLFVFAGSSSHESAYPMGMSSSGAIVGQYGSGGPFDPLAKSVILTRDRTVLLANATDSLKFAMALDNSGLAVGSSSNFPVAWVDGVPRALAPAGGLVQGSAHGVNSSGLICGTLFNDLTGQQIPVVWPNAASPAGTVLPLGGATDGAAFAVNGAGVLGGLVAGGSVGNFVATRWDSSSQAPVLLGVLPGAMNSEVLGLNGDGDAVGRSSFPDFSIRAFLHVRRTNTLTPLGTLGGNYSTARGVNIHRSVVGTSSTPASEVRAFLWQAGALHDLTTLVQASNQPILHIADAVAIDDTGRIAVEVVVASATGPVSRIGLLTPN